MFNRREFTTAVAAAAAFLPFTPVNAHASGPLQSDDLPLALRAVLDSCGANVLPMRSIAAGSRIAPDHRHRVQCHMDIEGDLDKLHDFEIVKTLARSVYRAVRHRRKVAVRFIPLVIPSRGIVAVKDLKGAAVAMRLLTCYSPFDDRLISRMDVLFEVV